MGNNFYPEFCPNCEVNLIGAEIPEKYRHEYQADHYMRVIGVYSLDDDRTIAWRCPDCSHEWERK